ncbi:MAG: putative multidrug ABC transporter ATP-binding protein YbhF [Anaerolineae bacterium]|nr:putative multidrug ABC transporter ATP-binding protein YbhF [Anaerolineae bacterium]
MINLDQLTKTFGETIAVNAVSYAIAAGEIFGVIGPDGAGKTTTLRVIATAMQPTQGSVTVDGLDVVKDAERVKNIIGYMPQRFALYPDLTVVENLNFFADMFGAPRAERAAQIERLLGFARLTDFKTRRAQNLSGGMQKKLALAATLMHRPRVLLLDEPTTGVDPVSRREFWDLLTNVHLDGVTIVVSTPYLDEAERCAHVALMHRGKLVACDEPNRLRAQLGAFVYEARSTQARAAERAAQALAGVLNVNTYGDIVRVIVDDPARRAALENAWRARAISIQRLQQVAPRLEDVFVLKISGAFD